MHRKVHSHKCVLNKWCCEMYQWKTSHNPTKIRERKLPYSLHHCFIETPESGRLRNNRHLFLAILEAGHPWPWCPCGEVGASPLNSHFSLRPTWVKGWRRSLGPLLEGHWPWPGAPNFSGLNQLPRGSFTNSVPLVVRSNILSLRDINRQSIAKGSSSVPTG